MELLNPTLTIQNTDQQFWLVRMQQTVSECEAIDITLKVARTNESLPQIQQRLLGQAIDLMNAMRSAG